MKEPWIFDSHAHYNDRRFDDDRKELLSSMPENGVGYIMNVGCCLASSRDCVTLAETYDHIYCAVGSHPDHADEVNDEVLEKYRQMVADHPKIKAIGEIGLDYYYEDIPREIQKRAFRMQLELARELNLPVIIHERDAHGDAFDIVREFPDVRGVFHCFSGSREFARELVKRGWHIGFTGVITFKNARKAVETAEWVPLDRLLLETDCPYMAPEPFRGRRSDSTMVIKMAEKIADLRGLPVEDICRITRENTMRLFGIEL